jgi:ABC-type enterochelin transport system substrate-binding protein
MNDQTPWGIITGCVVFLIAVAILAMWGCPNYTVYQQRLSGEAELAKAEYSRKTTVVEAQAKQQSAMSLAAADTLRAMGVARSNQIIGQSLKDNPDYLKWLWVESLKERNGDIIYVPTEANLPILEARRAPSK